MPQGKYADKLQSKKYKIIICSLCAVLFICALLAVFFLNWSITIHTNMIPEHIEYNARIQMPTATVYGKLFYKNGFSIPVETKSAISFDKVGAYEQTYVAQWLCFKAVETKTVMVVDSVAPTITFKTSDDGTCVYEAFDEHDGDLTSQVKVFEEDELITYVVQDSSGNTCTEYKQVPPKPINAAPTITINGPKELTIRQGAVYKDLGAYAVSFDGQDVSNYIYTISNVDITAAGTYTVTYTVIDDEGNQQATAKRTVNIVSLQDNQYERSNIGANKVVYLTFDDGPTSYTPKLLAILKKYNVKATFFVVGNTGYLNYAKNIVSDGHSIGIHSVSHSYKSIYASKEAFFDDLYSMQNKIKDKTGVETYLMRFPGGGSNTVSKNYKVGIMTELSKAVEDAGFVYFDWNVSSGDAGGATTSNQVFANVINGLQRNKASIVLQHDTKDFSIAAVEEIIQWGLANGYIFAPLDMNSPTAHHPINN